MKLVNYPDLALRLKHLYQNADEHDIIVEHDNVNGTYLKFFNEKKLGKIPTEQQLDDSLKEFNEYNKLKLVHKNRKKEYTSIQEQLDMLYWDKVNNTNLWQEHISAVKAKYPKD